jgi:hypothetical protein
MLAVIIPTVWLAIALFFLALCRMAARGDESRAAPGPRVLAQAPPLRTVTLAPSSRLHRRYSTTPCRTAGARTVSRAPLRAAHGARQRP